jgi:hypothetical protein
LHNFGPTGAFDWFGIDVDGVGDVDGDNYDDFIVGAMGADADPGYAKIYSGQTGAEIQSLTLPGGRFGEAVDGLGDVNGDGLPDVLCTNKWASGTAGETYVYFLGTICGCNCPNQSDFDEDGFLTALDLGAMIDILFSGSPDVQDSSCLSPRADFDCDGFSTALDLGGLIDHLFAGGDGPCSPCAL